MKTKIVLFIVAIALISFGLADTSFAFHAGGVAACESCHTMHNSKGGTAMATELSQFQAGQFLLQGTDPSSACLNCHEGSAGSYHISTAGTQTITSTPIQRGPGGDFSWLEVGGETRGHNIIAADNGYTLKDSRFTTSPGGSYPADVLACSSCHDPHGKYRRLVDGSIVTSGAPTDGSGSTGNVPAAGTALGSFRLLAGIGYQPKSAPSAPAFTADPPVAVSPATYNRSENVTMTRMAYGSGMSEWCANCHGSIHNDTYTSGQTGANTIHPAGNGAKLNAIAANYNAYINTSDTTGGNSASSYQSLIPFETGDNWSNVAALKTLAVFDDTQLSGPSSNSNVMCLSCHRAHATAFASMTRFDIAEIITDEDTAGVVIYTGGLGSTATQASYVDAYNGQPASKWGPFQRALCNKCHAKD